MEGRPVHCSACGRELDPNFESIVYFTWGRGLDGRTGPVLALCPTTSEQLDAGATSPCVAAALKLFRAADISPVPATYAEWLESFLRQSAEGPEKLSLRLLLAGRQPKPS